MSEQKPIQIFSNTDDNIGVNLPINKTKHAQKKLREKN